jgi:hypothetical protein
MESVRRDWTSAVVRVTTGRGRVARRVRLVGFGGVLLGLGCVLLGFWGFVYACNTETSACKGVGAWSTRGALLYWGGWASIVLGLVILVVILVAWILRSMRK